MRSLQYFITVSNQESMKQCSKSWPNRSPSAWASNNKCSV